MRLRWSILAMAALFAVGMVSLDKSSALAGAPHGADPSKWEHFSGLDGHNEPAYGMGAQYQMSQDAIQWWKGVNGSSPLPGWFNDPTQWQTMTGQGYFIPKGLGGHAQWQMFTDGHLGGWQDANRDGLHDMFQSQATWDTAAASQLGGWLDSNKDGAHDAFQLWSANGAGIHDNKWLDYDRDYGHDGGGEHH